MPGSSPLLTPTLADHVPRDWTAALPWRLGSQIYVAVLGGPLAVTIIAVLNARRLRMPATLQFALAGIGVAVMAAVLLAASAVSADDVTRLFTQLSGAAAFGFMFLLQRPYDRAHQVFSPHIDEDDDYDSLWGPGVAAIIGGFVLTVILAGAFG